MDQHYQYRIFLKGESSNIVEFMQEHQQQIVDVQELDEHYLIQLDFNYEPDVMEQTVEYFPNGQEQKIEEWLNKFQYEDTEFFKLTDGYIVRAFNDPDFDDFEDRWYSQLLGLFMILSPVWFIGMSVFIYLYFS